MGRGIVWLIAAAAGVLVVGWLATTVSASDSSRAPYDPIVVQVDSPSDDGDTEGKQGNPTTPKPVKPVKPVKATRDATPEVVRPTPDDLGEDDELDDGPDNETDDDESDDD